MCSAGCPCEPSNNQTAWTSLTQEQLNYYGRTLPFKFDGKQTDSIKPYGNFTACMSDIIAGKYPNQFDSKSLQSYQDLAKTKTFQTGLKFLEYFEKQF